MGGAAPIPVALSLYLSDIVSQFLECLGAARTPSDGEDVALTRVVAAILTKTSPVAVCVRHPSRRAGVYTGSSATFLKHQVRKS